MSVERTKTDAAATTDLLARQEGAFERCSIRSITPVSTTVTSGGNPDSANLQVPDSCFNARHVLVQVEAVDGERHTLALSPHFTAYDGRLLALRDVLSEGFVWYAHREDLTETVRDWNVVLAPTRERAKELDQTGVPFGALTFGELFKTMARSITTVGGLFGNVHVRDRPNDILTAYDRQNFTGDLPEGRADLDTFLSVAPERAEPAEIVSVPSHNKLVLLKDGHTFPLRFSGRATDDDHTPTALAECLGVRTVENLVNERVNIVPNVHEDILSISPVGSNKSETFALAPHQ